MHVCVCVCVCSQFRVRPLPPFVNLLHALFLFLISSADLAVGKSSKCGHSLGAVYAVLSSTKRLAQEGDGPPFKLGFQLQRDTNLDMCTNKSTYTTRLSETQVKT